MNKIKACLVIVIIVVFSGCIGLFPVAPVSVASLGVEEGSADAFGFDLPPEPETTPQPTPAPTPQPTPEPAKISIMAVGDIMFHRAQIDAAYDKETKTHDFSYSYQFVKDILSSADLAIGNLECPLAGPGRPYSVANGKSFNAPDSAAIALKEAGFDVLSTINNHSHDRRLAGLLRTIDTLREAGIVCAGTRKDADEPRFFMTDLQGIRVGVTAYSYGDKNADYANLYARSNTQKALETIGQTVIEMREAGAEIVILFIHWGSEYQRKPTGQQTKLAHVLCEAGVDIIFGSHPHVLQPVDILTSESGHRTIVAYSLGNFISNQRTRFNPKFKYTEDCMILNVSVTKPFGENAYVSGVAYLPTWTMMYTSGGKRHYTVLPIEKALAKPEAYDLLTEYDKKKAQKSLDDTNALLADAIERGLLSLMPLD